MKRGFGKALAAGLFAAAAVAVLPAGAASAAVAPSPLQCSGERLCMYSHANYDGVFAAFSYSEPDVRPFGISKMASSIINNTDHAWCAFARADYTGERREIPARTAIRDLSSPFWKFNDRIQSVEPGAC
ncbi:peptidase inhibitor family I36 protein [Nocardiopsis rhodophaea]|uniref:peptidase inhibitor family I36 protein n=1 Tax=Nocardiopsis rhodophaea TaxID=280238 RepID=UPI0031E0F904